MIIYCILKSQCFIYYFVLQRQKLVFMDSGGKLEPFSLTTFLGPIPYCALTKASWIDLPPLQSVAARSSTLVAEMPSDRETEI